MPIPTRTLELEWQALLAGDVPLQLNTRNRIVVRREVIPIIFVPGIMGSRLRAAGRKGTRETAWDPDDTLHVTPPPQRSPGDPDPGPESLLSHLRRVRLGSFVRQGLSEDARKKKNRLVGDEFSPGYLEPLLDDTDHDVLRFGHLRTPPGFPSLAERRWGGVAWSFYGDMLKRLHQHSWSTPLRTAFHLPVHAFPYNWTDSNYRSGEKLRQHIDELIRFYDRDVHSCRQVILVTHSMGGLVARSACKLHGAEAKVLGVVHGVQPTLGSAAAYWRMKAGWEREGLLGSVIARVLGYDSAQVTALLGNMPGGLELLPNQLYRDDEGRREWFRIVDAKSNVAVLRLPRRDPYQEIYRERGAFWRLIDPELLDPAAAPSGKKREARVQEVWERYLLRIGRVRDFHAALGEYVHPQSYHFHSEGRDSAGSITYLREQVPAREVVEPFLSEGAAAWVFSRYTAAQHCALMNRVAGENGQFHHYEAIPRGGHTDYLLQPTDPVVRYTLRPKQDSGDGTVPRCSGAALGRRPGALTYRLEGVEHGEAYRDEQAQARTLAAIEWLCGTRIERETGRKLRPSPLSHVSVTIEAAAPIR